jgi:hypothetical protein
MENVGPDGMVREKIAELLARENESAVSSSRRSSSRESSSAIPEEVPAPRYASEE